VLKVLRKRRQSVLVIAPLGAIIVVFVFWGIGTVMTDRLQVVAKVNGEVIPVVELQRLVDNLQRSYRDLGPDALPPEMLRGQALDQLITLRLLSQEAQRLGLQVSDEELRESIAGIPAFQVDGRFDKGQYLAVLRANGRTPADFEEAQRAQVLVDKLQELVVAGAHVSQAEVKERFRFDNERVVLSYVKLEAAGFLPQVTLSDEDLKGYYEAHREEFREPERMRIEALFFDPQVFAAKATPTDAEIEAYYDANQDDFRKPEEVHARHILFRVGPGATAEEQEAIRSKAGGVLKELEGGGDFAALAQQHSEDATASAGGDLGWFGRGRMVPSFEQAAFALSPGAISEVVESPFGFHIIKVEDKRSERVEPLEEARETVVERMRAQRGRELALEAVEAAHDRLLDGEELAKVAADIGVGVQTPPPFARTESVVGLGQDPELLKTVFETDTGEVGEIVSLESGYVAFRALERIDSYVPDLAVIRDRVEEALRRERAAALAGERAQRLLKQLQETRDLGALALAEGLTVEETGPVGRIGAFVPGIGNAQDLKDAAFALTPETPVAPSVYEVQGDAVLAVLKERMPPDEATFAIQEATLTEQSRRRLEAALRRAFIDHLKSKAQIEVGQGYQIFGG
jgi:peptidyl-prolyl cis-trans isomerase D